MPGRDIKEVDQIIHNDEDDASNGATGQRTNKSGLRMYSLFGAWKVVDSDEEKEEEEDSDGE